MRYLPLFHRLDGRPVVVAGGGVVAARKIRWLRKAGADVRVVAPELCEELAQDESIEHVARKFEPDDVEHAVLVVAATNSAEVNEQVAIAAEAHHVPVNVVDDIVNSNVIFPSIVDRDPVTVAISTSGEAPTLARWLRGRLEVFLSARLGEVARFIGAKRREWLERGERIPRQVWEQVVEAPPDQAQATFERVISEERPAVGQVAIVGAGPGDPELLTIKALQLMQNADLVLYDNLVNREVLEYSRRDAERRYVGKKRAFDGTRQEDINEQLVSAALAGQNVVRLKGGDPFIFGRGGEEIATLAGRGISCVVVPGITAALGAASYAGIPLTYRNLSQSVHFVTGHRARGTVRLDWEMLARPEQTLVFYMGLFNLDEIAGELVRAGMAPEVPVALVEHATLSNQRVHECTLADAAQTAERQDVSGPTTVIIGEVVRLRTPMVTDSSSDGAGPQSLPPA